MTQQWKLHWYLVIITALFMMNCAGCTKDTSVEEDHQTKIDAKFLAAWYNRTDSVGFEVYADGSTKNLSVDSLGKLQYAPASDTVKNGTIILNILRTTEEEIHLRIIYRVPRFIDTTVTVVGSYRFSADTDTLRLTVPDPSTSQPTLFTYLRSIIGSIVAAR